MKLCNDKNWSNKIKFIYTENVIRVVLFVALLWPPKIYFDRWVFYFSVYGERQIFICSAANVTITVCYTLINSAIIQKKIESIFFHATLPQPVFTCSQLTIETPEQVWNMFKLTLKTPEQCHWSHSGERISHLVLVFLLLTLNM